jgi:hypothetical protein
MNNLAANILGFEQKSLSSLCSGFSKFSFYLRATAMSQSLVMSGVLDGTQGLLPPVIAPIIAAGAVTNQSAIDARGLEISKFRLRGTCSIFSSSVL